jgi:hypothetical protein
MHIFLKCFAPGMCLISTFCLPLSAQVDDPCVDIRSVQCRQKVANLAQESLKKQFPNISVNAIEDVLVFSDPSAFKDRADRVSFHGAVDSMKTNLCQVGFNGIRIQPKPNAGEEYGLGCERTTDHVPTAAGGTATAQTGKWVVKRETNPMDNVTTTAEVLVSEGKDAGLIISCTGKKIDLVVRTDKVVDDALPSVRVKLDDHEVVRSTWYRIENYKGMIPPDLPGHSAAAEAIIKAISLSKKLYFAYNAYLEGETIVSFVVEGLPFSQCEK